MTTSTKPHGDPSGSSTKFKENGMRQERTTYCPGCLIEIVIPHSRPGSKTRKFCKECKNHPRHNAMRQAGNSFGLTFAELEELYAVTQCQICERTLRDGGGPGKSGKENRQIDHCHKTGLIRGVLCWACNAAIGQLGDDVESVQKALDYLRRAYDNPSLLGRRD